jgi:predicted 3-demethylubiquinone-9 3-methyltransferase (glyoxalase superfamily)/uncharacterized protein YndB with AHSA1/START domain
MTNKIYPCLWFDGQAKAAAELYCSIFTNSKITVDTPMVVNFELNGHKFMGLNGGPQFKPNAAISFFVVCKTEAEVDFLWSKLSEGGSLQPLNKYAWAEKYGWGQDRFGITWQIMLDKTATTNQTITASMLFTEGVHGKGGEAIDFYSSIFKDAAIYTKVPYEQGESTYATVDMFKFSLFSLLGKTFTIMDAGMPQDYTFNEAVSYVIDCENQEEVDYYWEKLTADGGQESQCGWLKDKYGVSWQIIPRQLGALMNDPDTAKAGRVMQAMLLMKKIDIQKLKQAAMEEKTVITVKATVNAPVEKVWQLWTEPQHIMKWNHASDDWHTPKSENDLRVGGKFSATMAAKDGSFSFDFWGIYDVVKPLHKIEYTMGDGRKAWITFSKLKDKTKVVEKFEAEGENSLELQQGGWQAILNNFKRYAENG